MQKLIMKNWQLETVIKWFSLNCKKKRVRTWRYYNTWLETSRHFSKYCIKFYFIFNQFIFVIPKSVFSTGNISCWSSCSDLIWSDLIPQNYIFEVPPGKLHIGNIEGMIYFCHSLAFVHTSCSNIWYTAKKNTWLAKKIIGETTF